MTELDALAELPQINANHGNPIMPFTAALRYAFRKSSHSAHIYGFEDSYDEKIKKNIATFLLHTLSIKPKELSKLSDYNLTFTQSTTQGFRIVIEKLVKKHQTHENLMNQMRRKYDKPELHRKPVIILPVPTYGLFINVLDKNKIDIVELERDENGRVDRKSLAAIMKELNADNSRTAIGYFDSNPNNPTGYVRSERETNALAKLFLVHNQKIRDFHTKLCNSNLDNEICRKLSENGSNTLKIIDDMVYLGTEWGPKKASSFLSVPGMAQDSYLLAGASKIGLADMRAGVLIHPWSEQKHFAREVHDDTANLSKMALLALETCFPVDKKLVNMRNKHLDDMNQQHRFSGLFMKVLINGLADVKITRDDKARMLDVIMQHAGYTKSQAIQRLKTGLADVRISTSPQAGFFHLIDYSALKGKSCYQISQHNGHFYTQPESVIEEEYQIFYSLRAMNLHFLSGTNTGVSYSKKMFARISFSLEPKTVMQLVDRLDMALSIMMPDRPDVKARMEQAQAEKRIKAAKSRQDNNQPLNPS